MKIRQLSTAADVVDAIGRARLMAMLDRNPQDISNWLAAERFPATTFVVMTAELQAKRLKAPTSLWRMEEKVA